MISAGNSNTFGNGYSRPSAENPDYGLVGNPSTVEDSFSVASINNKIITTEVFEDNFVRSSFKSFPIAFDILAVTFDEITQKSLMLNWGVIPVVTEKPSSTDDMFDVAEKVALESGLVESGDNIVIVAGVPVGTGGTNTMRIRTVK